MLFSFSVYSFGLDYDVYRWFSNGFAALASVFPV